MKKGERYKVTDKGSEYISSWETGHIFTIASYETLHSYHWYWYASTDCGVRIRREDIENGLLERLQ